MAKLLSLFCLVLLGLSTVVTAAEKSGTLRHVVAFKFKSEASPARVAEVVREFRALQSKIPVIAAFETGTNVSPEGLDKGFTHGFILTFKTAADRDAYLVHPDHQAFGRLVGPVVADVFVIDFWAE